MSRIVLLDVSDNTYYFWIDINSDFQIILTYTTIPVWLSGPKVVKNFESFENCFFFFSDQKYRRNSNIVKHYNLK